MIKKLLWLFLCMIVFATSVPVHATTSDRGIPILNQESGIADKELYRYLTNLVNKNELYSKDLAAIEELTITDYDYEIKSLAGLSQLSMPKLKVLNIAIRGLQDINEVLSFPQLEELYLYQLSLPKLPASFNQLLQLKVLHIENGALQELPDSLYDMASLRSLTLKKLPLTKISSDIAKLVNMEELVLDDLNMQEVPSALFQLSQLSLLQLSNLKLQSLPSELEQLSRLVTLRLDHNLFESIPAVVFGLPNVQYMSFEANKLMKIDPQIQSMTRLQELNLGQNALKTLPIEMVNLMNLKLLDLSGNRWECLPVEFRYLASQDIFQTYQIRVCGDQESPNEEEKAPVLRVRDGALEGRGYTNTDVIIESDQNVNFIVNDVTSVARDIAMTFSLEGSYQVSAINQQGAIANTISFVIDKTKPVIKITGNYNELGLYYVEVAIEANEDGYFIVNGIKSSTSSRLLIVSDPMKYQVSFMDYAGNVSDYLDFVIETRASETKPDRKTLDASYLWFIILAISLGGGTYLFLKKGVREE